MQGNHEAKEPENQERPRAKSYVFQYTVNVDWNPLQHVHVHVPQRLKRLRQLHQLPYLIIHWYRTGDKHYEIMNVRALWIAQHKVWTESIS